MKGEGAMSEQERPEFKFQMTESQCEVVDAVEMHIATRMNALVDLYEKYSRMEVNNREFFVIAKREATNMIRLSDFANELFDAHGIA